MASPPELLVQIPNNFIQMFLIMPSTNIALLDKMAAKTKNRKLFKQCLLNYWLKFKIEYDSHKYFSLEPSPKLPC